MNRSTLLSSENESKEARRSALPADAYLDFIPLRSESSTNHVGGNAKKPSKYTKRHRVEQKRQKNDVKKSKSMVHFLDTWDPCMQDLENAIVLVVGTAKTGKKTIVAQLATQLGITEINSIDLRDCNNAKDQISSLAEAASSNGGVEPGIASTKSRQLAEEISRMVGRRHDDTQVSQDRLTFGVVASVADVKVRPQTHEMTANAAHFYIADSWGNVPRLVREKADFMILCGLQSPKCLRAIWKQHQRAFATSACLFRNDVDEATQNWQRAVIDVSVPVRQRTRPATVMKLPGSGEL